MIDAWLFDGVLALLCFEATMSRLVRAFPRLSTGTPFDPPSLDECQATYSGSGWISVRLCVLLWFKRFHNHGEPQSCTEGFDDLRGMHQVDPGEGSYRIARWSKTPGSGASQDRPR